MSYGDANGLAYVVCYAGTLSNTHAKADQHRAELNDRIVIRNDLLHEFINKATVSFFCNRCRNWWAMTF